MPNKVVLFIPLFSVTHCKSHRARRVLDDVVEVLPRYAQVFRGVGD
ncbi:MAG: hypothetical protein PHV02_18375 [Rhodocyclaceae bacterium]|nr:hypothetical protein [Rhodocyclaceae bacterium]